MPAKRFEAPDMKTALLRVKEELGSGAVILSTREKKGSDGRKSGVEITASLDRRPQQIDFQRGIRVERVYPDDDFTLTGVNHELNQIKEMLLNLTHRSKLSEHLRERRDLIKIFNDLIESEISPILAHGLIEQVAAAGNGVSLNPYEVLNKKLRSLLKVSDPFQSSIRKRNPKILTLIGPTGAGKTLTVAKLAAYITLKKRQQAALISLDGYRLGAAEQLGKYAEIIGLPFMACQDKKEFEESVELFKQTDIILVDTPGRALSSDDHLRELCEIITLSRENKVLLVFSATTKDRKLTELIKRTRTLAVEGSVVTKIDETDRYGNVINNLIRFKLPASFLTNGQKVPDDILPATPSRLAALVITPEKGV